MFEASEYTKPVEAFRDQGHTVINVGLVAGKVVKGKTAGTEATIDKALLMLE